MAVSAGFVLCLVGRCGGGCRGWRGLAISSPSLSSSKSRSMTSRSHRCWVVAVWYWCVAMHCWAALRVAWNSGVWRVRRCQYRSFAPKARLTEASHWWIWGVLRLRIFGAVWFRRYWSCGSKAVGSVSSNASTCSISSSLFLVMMMPSGWWRN